MDRILTVGDSISQAFRVCRRDLKVLVSILMLPTIVLVVGKMGTTWGAHQYLLLMSQGKSILQFGPYILPFVILFFGSIVTYVSLFWLLLKQLSYMRMIVLQSDDYDKELKAVKKHKWKMLAYMFLSIVGFFVWTFVLGIFFGIAAVVVKKAMLPVVFSVLLFLVGILFSVLSLIAILLPLILLFHVTVIEEKGFFATIGRTFDLSLRNFGKVLGFAILSYLCVVFVSFALQSPYQIFYLFHYIKSLYLGADNYANSPLLTVPLYMQMLALVWQSCIFMYLWPVFVLSAGHLYYSIRMKEDGIDIMQKIDQLTVKDQEGEFA